MKILQQWRDAARLEARSKVRNPKNTAVSPHMPREGLGVGVKKERKGCVYMCAIVPAALRPSWSMFLREQGTS